MQAELHSELPRTVVSPNSQSIVANMRNDRVVEWADTISHGSMVIDLEDLNDTLSPLPQEQREFIRPLMENYVIHTGNSFIQRIQFIAIVTKALATPVAGPTTAVIRKARPIGQTPTVSRPLSAPRSRPLSIGGSGQLQPHSLRSVSVGRKRPDAEEQAGSRQTNGSSKVVSKTHMESLTARLAKEPSLPVKKKQKLVKEAEERAMEQCTFVPNVQQVGKVSLSRTADRLFRSNTVASLLRASSPGGTRSRRNSVESTLSNSQTIPRSDRRLLNIDGEAAALEVPSPPPKAPQEPTIGDIVGRGRRRREPLLSSEEREVLKCTFKPKMETNNVPGRSLVAARVSHMRAHAEDVANTTRLKNKLDDGARRTRREEILKPASSPYSAKPTIQPAMGYARRAAMKKALERESSRTATGFAGLWRGVELGDDEESEDPVGFGVTASMSDPSWR
ncbi:hypothetical protein J8273_4180 [Carpediemonas membranifera]|uniref:Uncharacterized protein n=1 Tax=Carpediemonas membranifera TaxID=201153 RepID=A0A8J6BYH9_9EUKA|nr:hypothetical protein J8273_4180 [Carpediemonas membranifera]|eukprot:KAG9394506.1 hypothetical protein J8273_4180 [Carpediemonas membranifera]